MTMKFLKDETHRLLELYAEYECLWNLGLPSYKNRNLRKAAEAEIVERFAKPGFGLIELKQKIKNLRSTYNQECTKIHKSKKSGSGTLDIYVPNIKWFVIMDNIMKCAKGNKNSVESLTNQTLNTEVKVNLLDDENETEGELAILDAEPAPRGIQVEVIQVPTVNKRNVAGRGTATPPIKKKKMQHLVDAVKCLQRVSDSLSRETEIMSEEDVFGSYVAASLKKLPMAQSLMAQHEVQGILMKYRLNAIAAPEEEIFDHIRNSVGSTNEIVHDQQNIGREVVLDSRKEKPPFFHGNELNLTTTTL